ELLGDIFVNVPNLQMKPLHLARLAAQQILVHNGDRPIDFIDGWENKRIESIAGSMSQLFSSTFRGSVILMRTNPGSNNFKRVFSQDKKLLDEIVDSFGPKTTWGEKEHNFDIVNRTTNLALIAQIMRV